jgi:hypothetical protein
MKKFDLYGALFWAGLAVFVILSARQMGLGEPRAPGPGFFPLIVGLVLLLFSAFIAMEARWQRKKIFDFNVWPSFRGSVFASVGVLFAYSIFLLPFLGFLIGGFIILTYLFAIPGERKWWFSILFSAIVVSLCYYFFGILLEAQFPKGILDIG